MNSGAAPRIVCRVSASAAVASWNSGIRAAVDRGCPDQALYRFGQMHRAGHRPDWLTFPFVIKASANLADEGCAMAVHAAAVKSPFFSDVFVQTALVNMYLKLRRMACAAILFDEMPERDVAAWNAMLMGFSQLGSLSSMFSFFLEMRRNGFSPDLVSFVLLVQGCAAADSLPAVRCSHGLAVQVGAAGDVPVANTLISSYSKCGDLTAAESVFSEISPGGRTAVSWSSIIAGYARHGRPTEAAACFSEMRLRHDGAPEAGAAVSLLSLCAVSAALREGEAVHSLVIRGGLEVNSTVGNALISLYCKSGYLAAARRCFDGMMERTSVSWSAMIDAYASSGAVEKAVELFSAMEKPDEFAVAAIVSGSGDLDLGRSLHQHAIAGGLDSQVVVCNSLMDMYMKNGSPDEAQILFDSMDCRRTVVSWTTMISGYALNGRFRKAHPLFRRMVGGVAGAPPPNAVTFLAVLQGCSHGGLLEEGCKYFAMMTEVFDLAPSLEHYACMVDLLGRRGLLEEALSFVQAMPVDPDAGVWGALLGACGGRGEVELGEQAARRLQEIAPRAATAYVSLANAYAARGRWGAAAAVLAAMRRRGVRKLAGESSLRAGGRVHSFAAQDGSRPETGDIEEVVRALDAAMREDLLLDEH